MSSPRPRREVRNTRIPQPKTTTNGRPPKPHSMASPPSPIPRTSSPLSNSQTTSSSSNSNASASSPPITPRGRSVARYPSSLGRVPLHRRGTSHTYERLEDLLREAGYKETRVFTPEAERAENDSKDNEGTKGNRIGSGSSMRGGVGAVVGFLASLVPGGISRTSSLARADGEDVSSPSSPLKQPEYSPPSSPLAHKQHTKGSILSASPSSPSAPVTPSDVSSTHSIARSSRGPSTPIVKRTQSRSTMPEKHQITGHPQSHLIRPQTSTDIYNTPTRQTYTQASKAGAYLRHMASAPNMTPSSKRPPALSRLSHSGDTSQRPELVLNDSPADEARHEESDGAQPPLPQSWLETVARAVLFGGTGAYIGGPSTSLSHTGSVPNTKHMPALRPTRSSLSRVQRISQTRPQSALSDHTNFQAPRSRPIVPASKFNIPPLCAHIPRAPTTSGAVSRTRVVCRSAPSSRSGSRTRGETSGRRRDEGILADSWIGGRSSKGIRGKTSGKAKGERGRTSLPSLARTKTENDSWGRDMEAGRKGRDSPRGRYLSGWGVGDDDNIDEVFSSDPDDEEEDGELDLARILVPPKRQNSIRSLRKHLHGATGGSAQGSLRGGRPASRIGWGAGEINEDDHEQDEEHWRRGSQRRRRESMDSYGEGEGHGYGFEELLEAGMRNNSTKGTGTLRRRGIPGAWAQWTGAGTDPRS